MGDFTLVALLDEDKEMVLANLARDRALSAAQATLEKAVDRVMYRYVERCDDEAVRDSAQHILQAMKDTLPAMDAVGEARAWKKQVEAPRRAGLKMGPLTLAILLGGMVLVLASVLSALIGSRADGALAFLKVLLPVALGCGCLFWAGVRCARPPKKREKPDEPQAVRMEYLVDVEKAWHCLRGAMLLADGQLGRIREENAARSQSSAEAASAGGLPAGELELFSQLLESAYATPDDSGQEMISAMRFYLHNAGIDVVDYEAGRESWFEFLPAQAPGTLRPALILQGRPLKKGMASARR